MAYVAGRLFAIASAPPGRCVYIYDTDNTVDQVDDVEAADYFNNLDDNLNLAIGDQINVRSWSAVPYAAASTLVNDLQLIVTNVIANDAATSAGRVNTAQHYLGTTLFSSLL